MHRTLLTGIDRGILLAQEGRLDKKQENFWSYGELSIDIIRLGNKQALKNSGRWWKKSLVSIQLIWWGKTNEVSNTWYADYFDFGYKFPFLAFLFLSFFLNLRSHVHSEKMDFDIGAARSHWCWCVYIFPLLKPDFFQSFLRPIYLFYLLQESKFLFPFNFPALFFLP